MQYLLIKYLLIMQLRFGAMFYSNLGNENSDAGHIKCQRGSHLVVPRPSCNRSRFKKGWTFTIQIV